MDSYLLLVHAVVIWCDIMFLLARHRHQPSARPYLVVMPIMQFSVQRTRAHPSSRRGDTAMLSPASTAALKHTPMACWKVWMSSFVAGGHT